MKKPLKVNIYVSMKDKTVPYNSLTEEEKTSLAIRLNRRAIQAAAGAEGYEVEFLDHPVMETGTE